MPAGVLPDLRIDSPVLQAYQWRVLIEPHHHRHDYHHLFVCAHLVGKADSWSEESIMIYSYRIYILKDNNETGNQSQGH